MRRLVPAAAVAVLLSVVLSAAPVHSENQVYLSQDWTLGATKTQPHPKKQTVAYLVTEDYRLTSAAISYSSWRVAALSGQVPKRQSRGKMIAKLEILRGTKTITVGTQRAKIKRNRAFVAWAYPDGTVPTGDTKASNLLPLDLEAGDVILWSVRFKGAKQLDVEDTGSMTFQDYIELSSFNFNCGSFNFPCF